MLREHYRSDPQIIGFSKEEFYDNQIVIRTDLQRRGVPQDFIDTGCGAFWVHVDGTAEHPPGGSAFNRAELEALQNLIPDLLEGLR
jgi:superfamily I DNA and/or RNA helicase